MATENQAVRPTNLGFWGATRHSRRNMERQGVASDVRSTYRGAGGNIQGEGLEGYQGFHSGQGWEGQVQGLFPDWQSGTWGSFKHDFETDARMVSGNISHLSGVFSELQDTELAFNTVGGTTGVLHELETQTISGESRSYQYDITGDIKADRRSLRAAMGKEMTKRSAYLESFFWN